MIGNNDRRDGAVFVFMGYLYILMLPIIEFSELVRCARITRDHVVWLHPDEHRDHVARRRSEFAAKGIRSGSERD